MCTSLIVWQMETYFVNEKWDPRIHLAQQHYYTHVRLSYTCVIIWMVKMWQKFGCLSISPNFYGTKVSLHEVFKSYKLLNPDCLPPLVVKISLVATLCLGSN